MWFSSALCSYSLNKFPFVTDKHDKAADLSLCIRILMAPETAKDYNNSGSRKIGKKDLKKSVACENVTWWATHILFCFTKEAQTVQLCQQALQVHLWVPSEDTVSIWGGLHASCLQSCSKASVRIYHDISVEQRRAALSVSKMLVCWSSEVHLSMTLNKVVKDSQTVAFHNKTQLKKIHGNSCTFMSSFFPFSFLF